MKSVDYVLVDRASGEIEVSGTCLECDLPRQVVGDHQVMVIGPGSSATHYYAEGALCEYTPQQREAKQQQPLHCRWHNHLMCWVDMRPLDELRMARWVLIKVARQAAVEAVIATPWGAFDADAASRTAMASAASLKQPVAWTTADNQAVTLSAVQLQEVLRQIEQRTQNCHALARSLRARIDQAAHAEELAAIKWPPALE